MRLLDENTAMAPRSARNVPGERQIKSMFSSPYLKQIGPGGRQEKTSIESLVSPRERYVRHVHPAAPSQPLAPHIQQDGSHLARPPSSNFLNPHLDQQLPLRPVPPPLSSRPPTARPVTALALQALEAAGVVEQVAPRPATSNVSGAARNSIADNLAADERPPTAAPTLISEGVQTADFLLIPSRPPTAANVKSPRPFGIPELKDLQKRSFGASWSSTNSPRRREM